MKRLPRIIAGLFAAVLFTGILGLLLTTMPLYADEEKTEEKTPEAISGVSAEVTPLAGSLRPMQDVQEAKKTEEKTPEATSGVSAEVAPLADSP